MRANGQIEVGDVLRFSMFKHQKLRQPLWALVIWCNTFGCTAEVLRNGSCKTHTNGKQFGFRSLTQSTGMRVTTLPTEGHRLPDHVCVALAKRALS